jgi:hypothetical protein
MAGFPLRLVLSVGQPLLLARVQPLERALSYGDELYRAVESDVQGVAGDARREPSWIEFQTWLAGGPSPSGRAAALAAFEDALRYVDHAEIDGLTYPVTRIRVKTRSPAGSGYRLTVAMIGPNHDFQTSTGTPAPLW